MTAINICVLSGMICRQPGSDSVRHWKWSSASRCSGWLKWRILQICRDLYNLSDHGTLNKGKALHLFFIRTLNISNWEDDSTTWCSLYSFLSQTSLGKLYPIVIKKANPGTESYQPNGLVKMKQSKNRYKKWTLYDRNTLRIEIRIRNGCDFKSLDTLKTWDNRKCA